MYAFLCGESFKNGRFNHVVSYEKNKVNLSGLSKCKQSNYNDKVKFNHSIENNYIGKVFIRI